MPNYCSNSITITGDKTQLTQLAEQIKADEETIMERLVPTPEDFGEGWYQWHLDKWGTKWDMIDLLAQYEEDYIQLDYLTAWSPNVAFWEIISERFPKLYMTHHYKEEGLCFAGVATYEDGSCNDQTINY